MTESKIINDDTELQLLRELRDDQRALLQVQREHHAMYLKQLERIERINDQAERLQNRAGRAQKLLFFVVLPATLILLALISWPSLRHYFG